jgi:hypothetical protein
MTGELDQTTRAVAAADEAPLRTAIESVRWDQRGLLQRLVRIDDEERPERPRAD